MQYNFSRTKSRMVQWTNAAGYVDSTWTPLETMVKFIIIISYKYTFVVIIFMFDHSINKGDNL